MTAELTAQQLTSRVQLILDDLVADKLDLRDQVLVLAAALAELMFQVKTISPTELEKYQRAIVDELNIAVERRNISSS